MEMGQLNMMVGFLSQNNSKSKIVKMKKLQIIMLVLLFVTSSSALAQQESMITFYKDHLNLVNPAAVSVKGETSITSSIRKQWTGVKDAPETQALSFMTPLKNNLSIGISMVRDQVFIEKQTFIGIDFSYKVKMNEDLDLFMGIKAGANNYEVNTNGLQTYNVQSDPSLQSTSGFNPNIGVGFYLKHDLYYISLSTPKMLNTERVKNANGYATTATDMAHYYLSAGSDFTLTKQLKLTPSMMMRYVKGAPLSIDFTATTEIDKVFHIGATYRTDNSLAGIVKFNVTSNWFLGCGYEFSLRSKLLDRAKGSSEFYLQYKF